MFVKQAEQLKNPDARVMSQSIDSSQLLSAIADYGKGSTTGDSPRFLQCFWQHNAIEPTFFLWLDSPKTKNAWDGRSLVCVVPVDHLELTQQLGCWIRGQQVWGRQGVVVNKMRDLQPFLYAGEVFDDNICPFMADDISGGKPGAGILRWKPNIKWEKDRGKDVAFTPWYHIFKGERINDYHLTNAEKRSARAKELQSTGGLG